MKLPHALEAFKYRNYRLFFFGQLISIFGSQMQGTAQGYLVFELTNSTSYLGTVSFMNTAPSFLFMLISGVILDYMERRDMMRITQSFMMVVAWVQAILVFTGIIQPWHILLLTFLLGTANAFDMPARQSITVDLVPKSRLGNAIALNSTIFNLGMILGPSAAGIIYAAFGPGWSFLINAISYIGILTALTLMRKETWKEPELPLSTAAATPTPINEDSVEGEAKPGRLAGILRDFQTGLRYIVEDKTAFLILCGVFVVNIGFSGLVPLLPAWAVNVLGGDVRTNGWLVSGRGLGALMGALLLATVSDRGIRGKLYTMGSLGMPIMMLVFSFTRTLPASLAAIMVMGFFFITMMNNSNALIQTRIPDHLRGRVMSVYSLCMMGGFSIGGLIMGNVASVVGEPMTVRISSGIILVFAVYVLLFQPRMRALR